MIRLKWWKIYPKCRWHLLIVAQIKGNAKWKAPPASFRGGHLAFSLTGKFVYTCAAAATDDDDDSFADVNMKFSGFTTGIVDQWLFRTPSGFQHQIGTVHSATWFSASLVGEGHYGSTPMVSCQPI